MSASDTLLSGGTNITFSTPGSENTNLNTFQHTFQHDVTLDSSGQATLGFAAATTEMSETAKITSIEYVNANTYTYTFSYSTSLNDTDGSETLTLKLNNVPDGENLTLTSGNGYTMTSNNNGTYTITGFSAGSTSVNDTVTLEITRLNEPDFSSIQIEATATESSNSDTATTTASVNNTAPTISGDLGATVNEGGSVVLTTTDLNFSDSDITDTASNVTFTASSFTNGSISVNGASQNTFTGTQLASGQVSFVHDGSSATSGTFNVNVEDGNEDLSSPTNSTFQITVNSTNTIPSGTVLFDGDSDTYTQVFDGDNSDGSGSGDDNSWTSSSSSSGITNERLEYQQMEQTSQRYLTLTS